MEKFSVLSIKFPYKSNANVTKFLVCNFGKNSCSDKIYGTEAKEGVGGQREAEIVSGTQSTNGYGRSVDERM